MDSSMQSAAQARREGHGRDGGYYDLLSYIVSQAVSGEIMAVENYSEMVPLMATPAGRIEANKQAAEECKHILVLSKLAKNLGFPVEQRIVEPQWKRIREHFSAAVRKKDLAACLIIQDLMTETMAIVLYRLLSGEADTDEHTRGVARNVLKDEMEHLEMGIARIKKMLAEDPVGVHDSLAWAHHRVMPELYAMISTSCDTLCDDLNVECGSLTLEKISTDIDAIRVKAMDQYLDTLERVGFDEEKVRPLVASMSSFTVGDTLELGRGCCAPSGAASDTKRCC